MSVETSAHHHCWVISNVRGDFHLFRALLTVVCPVTKFEKGVFTWRGEHNTVVVLGNFTDRYSNSSYTRLTIPTGRAIGDEIRILDAMSHLQRTGLDNDNRLIVVMGDHEIGNLAHWSSYKQFQIANPASASEQKLRENFVEQQLRPFCARQRLLYRWGDDSGLLYFAHAGFRTKWLDKTPRVRGYDFYSSIQQLFRHWCRSPKPRGVFGASLDTEWSPVKDTFMATQPQTWARKEHDLVVRKLNGEAVNNSSPRFVLAGVFVQELESQYVGAFLRPLSKPDGTLSQTQILTYRPDGETTLMYHLRNGQADAYACKWADVERRPQALHFTLRPGLYLTAEPRSLTASQYLIYMENQPLSLCRRVPKVTSDTPLTEAELEAVLPFASDETKQSLNRQDDTVNEVFVVFLNRSGKQIWLLRNGDQAAKWRLPGGQRTRPESPWKTMTRHYLAQTGNSSLPELGRQGRRVAYTRDVVLFVYKVRDPVIDFHPTKAYPEFQSVCLNDVFTRDLELPTKHFLCSLMTMRIIPRSNGYHEACPAWLKS